MKVQVTVVISDGKHASQVGSTSMLLLPGGVDDPDVIVANAARVVARRLGLGKPTPRKEGGRG